LFVLNSYHRSPERLTGEPYDFSSDIWSLGLVLIELATGEYPYKKTKKFIEMLQTITTSPEPNLPDNDLYSDEFKDFIKKCLNKDPKKRSTAAQLMV
jgi:serine/threonine protein kinase